MKRYLLSIIAAVGSMTASVQVPPIVDGFYRQNGIGFYPWTGRTINAHKAYINIQPK